MKFDEKFLEGLGNFISTELAKTAEPLIAQAIKDVEIQMRQKLGAIVIGISKDYRIEAMGDTLQIVVKIGAPK